MISGTHIQALIEWQQTNGGVTVHPKYDALKLLEEVLELCYASGCISDEVNSVVINEQLKAHERNEDLGKTTPDSRHKEYGDALACLAMYALKHGIDSHTAMVDVLERIKKRTWAPDKGGVLRRPR